MKIILCSYDIKNESKISKIYCFYLNHNHRYIHWRRHKPKVYLGYFFHFLISYHEQSAIYKCDSIISNSNEWSAKPFIPRLNPNKSKSNTNKAISILCRSGHKSLFSYWHSFCLSFNWYVAILNMKHKYEDEKYEMMPWNKFFTWFFSGRRHIFFIISTSETLWIL